MSEQATVSTGSDRRTIGAILRSHGYVTDAQLHEAADVQARTGKPLGQVLVEAGSITRLELASALAEQWSDSSEWMHSQDGGAYSGSSGDSNGAIGLTASRHAADDGVLASRLSAVEAALQDVLRSEPSSGPLEHAIADLARRLTTWEPVLAELERRSDSAVDTDELESQLGEFAETIETALRRADASAEALADFGARLDELQLAIRHARDDASTASASAASELARLASAVESVKQDAAASEPAVSRAEISDLRSWLTELASRPAGSPELQARLDDLASRVDEVASRPVADRELAERVERLSQLVAVITQDSRLETLQSQVAYLASRPTENPELTERLDDLSRRIDALVADAGARVDGDVSDELRAALEELATRPPVDAALAARVEELAQRLAELPAHTTGYDESHVAELTSGMEMLAGRLSELERGGDIRALTREIEELKRRPVVEAGLGDRVWRLAERIDELADATTIAATDGSHEAEIRDLRATVDGLASRPAGDPDRLDWMATRVDDVARQIDDLSRSLSALASTPPPAASPELIAGIEARLDDLARQVADLPVQSTEPLDADAVSAEIESRLMDHLDEQLATRPAGPDPATEVLAAELSRNAELWYAGRAALEARLEGLEARIAARPAPVAAATGGDAELVPHVFEQEVERVLMAVERLGLHLSEHDRALAELMSRRGSSKVEELAARVDELETYGVATGAVVAGTGADGAPAPVSLADTRDLRGELRSLTRQVTELEDSSKADREKFLTQLERMASSIDWRIRRIESGDGTS
jgi:chaperonin cofactor prefoldin